MKLSVNFVCKLLILELTNEVIGHVRSRNLCLPALCSNVISECDIYERCNVSLTTLAKLLLLLNVFCRYSSSMKSLGNKFMHLTNYSVNKKNAEYQNNSDDKSCQGHKWYEQKMKVCAYRPQPLYITFYCIYCSYIL